jgi:hypothetical protein
MNRADHENGSRAVDPLLVEEGKVQNASKT